MNFSHLALRLKNLERVKWKIAMKKNLACLIFICLSGQSFAQSYEGDVAKLIAQHDEHAKNSCERIKNDETWRKVADILNERLNYFNNLSETERRSIDLSVKSWSDSWRELKKSPDIHSQIFEERVKKAPELNQALSKYTRLARVLKHCGEELFNSGILPPELPAYQPTSVSSDKVKERISALIYNLQEHDESWLAIAKNVRKESPATVQGNLGDYSYNSRILDRSNSIANLFWFPMHDLYKDGDQFFAKQIDLDALSRDTKKTISTAEANLSRDKVRHAEDLKKKNNQALEAKERDSRIAAIKKGNLKIAKSCIEIAAALIPNDELGGNFDIALSKDFQDVHVQPTKKLYAGIGKVFDSEKNKISVLQSDEFRKKQFVFQLTHNERTIWFGEKFATGNYLTFVGRYIANENTVMRQGANSVEIPSRVYDLVCVSSK